MTSAGDRGSGANERIAVRILEARAVDEMVGKIRAAAASPTSAAAVTVWMAEHGDELANDRGHDHVVVGATLMYLHDAPDGMLVPHVRHPDGTEEIFTDAAHADEVF